MKASDLLVKALESEGVEHIFGIPGEENLDLLESLSKSAIELVLTRHEQAAGFMAATCGRLTGRPGVCLSTLGPGATNLVTAAAYANLGGMPMLMITGQKPIKTSKQGQFQIVDVVDMMNPLTKYTRQIESGERIPACVREAFRLAREERPGATHLELPEDIAQEETETPVIPPSYWRRPVAEEKAIEKAVDLIRNAERPILLIGAAANRKLTCQMLRRFVDQTGIAFATTQMGKGVVSEDHELFLGNAALSSGDFLHRALDASDLIINVGHEVVEKPPFFMKPGGRTVIHLNFTSAKVDPVYFPQIEVIGDIANSIWQFTERLPKQRRSLPGIFSQVQTAFHGHQQQSLDDSRFPVVPQQLVHELRLALPRDGIIALDNGMYKIWFARDFPAYEPNTVLLDNALATMGAGLPSAMAAKIIYPQRKVVAVMGDGGFMMNSAELETAVRLKLDLVALIIRDDALGMIKWKQQDMGFPDHGLDFENPDFVKYAESYGASGYRIESLNELTEVLRSTLDTGGIHLIEVPIDYSDNHRILNQEIQQLSGQIKFES